jgi:exosortase
VVLVLLGIGIHLLGYRVQQVRISIIGFFLGWYGIMGMVWGRAWLQAVFFPYILFAFCFPIGTLADRISVPLRLLSSVITEDVSNLLGIKVIRNGTMLSNMAGDYRYEVAAACSGLRSLIATLGIAIVYGFLTFKSGWRRGLMVASAIPLAVAANVTRLMMIILAGEVFGQSGGEYVHDSSVLSMIPYLVAFLGMFFLAHLFRENRDKKRRRPDPEEPDESEETETEEVARD